MKKLIILILFVCAIFVACSNTSDKPELKIDEVWSRPVAVADSTSGQGHEMQGMEGMHAMHQMAMGVNGIVYLKITNAGKAADRLIKAASEICSVVEIHETKMIDGRMEMQMLAEGLAIPAGATTELKPQSYHIMLIGLKRSLNPGDKFPVNLQFEKSGTITVSSEVRLP